MNAKIQEPTVGRVVHYALSAGDAEQINRRRTDGSSISERIRATPPQWPVGAQAHIGNTAHAGDVVPLLIVRTWHTQGVYERGVSVLNGQATLDGNDTLWVTSAHEGESEGTWCWPPRV